jgi:hypothetical protein
MNSRARKLSRRTVAGVIGVAATVLLHSVLFAVVMWSAGQAKFTRLPDAVGAGANTGRPDGDSTERMIVIQLSPNANIPMPEQEHTPHLVTEARQPSMVQVTSPDAMPLPPLEFDNEGVAKEASDADLIARTKLAGLYESQIRARIERAWSQPTKDKYAAPYSCRVRVHQKRDGQVEDVIFENCEGSYEWLNSLVQAIYSASPLPGAPHPGVFAGSFSMQFHSVATQPD